MRCHQHADDTQLYLSLTSKPDGSVEVLNRLVCREAAQGLHRQPDPIEGADLWLKGPTRSWPMVGSSGLLLLASAALLASDPCSDCIHDLIIAYSNYCT